MAHRIINGTIDKEMEMLKRQVRDASLDPSAARALRAIPSEARSETSRSNGAKGGRVPHVYTLSSAKGQHGTVSGYRSAIARAREVQAEMQAAYGVDVTAPDGRTVYTAR